MDGFQLPVSYQNPSLQHYVLTHARRLPDTVWDDSISVVRVVVVVVTVVVDIILVVRVAPIR